MMAADRIHRGRRLCAVVALTTAGSWIAGCPTVAPDTLNGTALTDGNQDETVTSPLGKTSGEPNGTFGSAVVAVFDGQGVARLQGTVSVSSDLDVFRLIGLSPGDRVVLDAATVNSALDVSVALFDSQQRLVYANDDRETAGDRFLDSYIDWTVRHASDPYYLVVTRSAFAGSGRRAGTYTVEVTVTSGNPVPPPTQQVLLLNFAGGMIDSPVLGTFTLDAFDAGAISPVYTGQTAAMKQVIRDTMEQNYQRFNVTVVTSDDPPMLPGAEFSTIHFGGFDSFAFGIAEQVDLYNADFCDDAIIFSESFEPRLFSFTPTVQQMAIAIGNVAAHEAGHLLGLNHVQDDLALMDDQSAADAFVDDQEFMEAPLSPDIIPIGTQDAVLLLNEIVGPSN